MRAPNPRTASPGRLVRLLTPLLLAPILAGCSGGDGLPRQAVSGSVTLAGEPLDGGRIHFEPTGGEQATQGGAVISGGTYRISREEGLVPGEYRVSISAGATGGSDEAPGAPGAMMAERIPAQYNAQSTLAAEVTSGGKNTFDFELQP